MSIIIPAGMNKLQWSPKAEQEAKAMVKTASVTAEAAEEVIEAEEKIEDDPLAAAAKSFLEQKEAATTCAKCATCGKCSSTDECDCKGKCECKKEEDGDKEAASDEVTKEACGIVSQDEIVEEAPCCGEEPAGEAIVLDVSDEGEVALDEGEGFVEDVVEEPVGGAASAVEEAVEKAEEALEEVKEAVENIEGANEDMGVSEVEVSVEDEGPVDEGEEVPGVMEEEDGDEEVEKEGMYAQMSDSEEFCKFAKLSDKNRSKLADYWVNMLGYPSDYVSLMTKDYEK